MLGREDEDEDEDGAEGGVAPEQPGGEAVAADAVEVVAGEDGEGRDGGQDVAGSLEVEKVKKRMGKRAQRTRNSGKASPARPWPK